jgi:hypothetical protein
VVCGGREGQDHPDRLVEVRVDLEEEGHDEEEVVHDDAALEAAEAHAVAHGAAVHDEEARDEGCVVVEGYASSC